MSQKAAPLTHDLLARKGEARAAGRLHDVVADNRLDTEQSNPAPQPQKSMQRPARPIRFIAASLAVGLVSGIASYLIFAKSTPEMPEQTVSARALPMRDAPLKVSAAAPVAGYGADADLQPAAGPEHRAVPPIPTRPAEAPTRIAAGNAPAIPVVAPQATPPEPEPVVRTAEATDAAAPAPPKPVAEPAVRPSQAKPATPATPYFALQLASLKNEDVANREVARLQQRLGDTLNDRTITVERADLVKRGVFYRLRVGNFPSAKQAAALCQTLKERRQSCLVVRR